MAFVNKLITKNNKILLMNNKPLSKSIFDNKIIINFDSEPTNIQINKANLKYDKDFAYSFFLDDGYSSSYSIIFPLFQGILISGGTFISGLTYTDGCGNDINFSAGLSIYSTNSDGSDIHINTPSYMTWDEITELIDFGWSIFNHGYHSSITGGTYDDYLYEITENKIYIKSKTNYDTVHLVIPNGEDEYIAPAWDSGILSQSANKSTFSWTGMTSTGSTTVPTDGVNVENINFNYYCMHRRFIFSPTGITTSDTGVTNNIILIANKSSGSTNYWWADFTHRIDNPSGTSSGNLNIATLNYYMNYIQENYGKMGNDKIWMASFQEVYDYIRMRDNLNITYEQNGNSLTIKLNQLSSLPLLRYLNTSLIISNDNANIESIILDGYSNYSYNGTGTTTSLINLDWSEGVVSLAEKYVKLAETQKTQVSINKAQYFVNKIYVPETKSIYQTRINNIVIPDLKILINFGYTIASTTTGITFSGQTNIWNQFNGYLTGNTYNLTDSNGVLTNANIYIVSAFTNRQNFVTTTGNDSGIYPDSRMARYININLGALAYLRISGLTDTYKYKFTFFGSNNQNNGHTTNYTIGDVTVSLSTYLNTQNVVSIENVSPSSGTVIIKVNGTGTNNAYLNILEINQT